MSKAEGPRSVVEQLLDTIMRAIDTNSRENAGVLQKSPEARLHELEERVKKMSEISSMLEADTGNISTSLSVMTKSLITLAIQVQALYEVLGIDPRNALSLVRRRGSDVSVVVEDEESEDPGDEGAGGLGGLGGMLN